MDFRRDALDSGMVQNAVETGSENARGAHRNLASFKAFFRTHAKKDRVVLTATGDQRLAHAGDESTCRQDEQDNQNAATDGEAHPTRRPAEVSGGIAQRKEFHDHTARKHCEISRRETRQAGTTPARMPSPSAIMIPITRISGSEEISTFRPSMVML